MRLKKSLCAVLVGSMISSHVSAGALDNSIQDMFTNITTPGSIADNIRGAWYGGSAYVRTPNMVISPIQVDLPRFSAGCGGIDATLGAFSWISADKLMQFARKIIQQAVPVAFDQALAAFSPTLHQILSKFQTLAQNMNNFSMNSCQLATGLVDSLKDPVAAAQTTGTAIGGLFGATSGIAQDFTEGFKNFMEKPSQFFTDMLDRAKTTSAGKTKTEFQNIGNITWNALNDKQFELGNNFYIDADPEVSKQIIMSLLGSQVFRPQVPGDPTSVMIPVPLPKLIDYGDIVEDRADLKDRSIVIYKCDDFDKCIDPKKGTVSYDGIRGYVKKMLLGDPTAKEATPTSIIGVMGGSVCATNGSGMSCFTVAQKNFLSSISEVPVMGILRKAQFDPNVLNAVGRKMVDVITARTAVIYGYRLLRILRSIYAGSQVPPPPNFDATIRDISDAIARYEKKSEEEQKVIEEVAAQIQTALSTDPRLVPFRTKKTRAGN